jgi:hypothetical protein
MSTDTVVWGCFLTQNFKMTLNLATKIKQKKRVDYLKTWMCQFQHTHQSVEPDHVVSDKNSFRLVDCSFLTY